MKLDELKAKIEEYRKTLKANSGTTCLFSETGPVSMVLIDALFSTIEGQERRLAKLEKNITPFS